MELLGIHALRFSVLLKNSIDYCKYYGKRLDIPISISYSSKLISE